MGNNGDVHMILSILSFLLCLSLWLGLRLAHSSWVYEPSLIVKWSFIRFVLFFPFFSSYNFFDYYYIIAKMGSNVSKGLNY